MGRWKDKYVIGITGNIATGKSLVRKMLQHLGAFTLDADELAHQVMAPKAPAYRPVIEWFGRWIVGPDGRIDRNRLGTVAFSHPEALKRLESITHPIISKGIDTLISRSKHKIIAVEAIKLLEGPLGDQVDAIWVVDAPSERQVERLMQKRGLSEPEARKRITVQNPQADKLAAADVVIKNDADNPNETWKQVQAAWANIGGQEAEDDEKTVQVQPQSQPAGGAAGTAKRELKELRIKRPKPADLEAVANLINTAKNKNLSKADIMMSFSETSYLTVASEGEFIGVMNFVVDNLITQSSEIAILPDVPIEPVLSLLIKEMEAAADSLQSEVAFIYLKPGESGEVIKILQSVLDYEILEDVNAIKFPAWREALRSRPEDTIVIYKQLREDRILTPF